jgi:hypothetical protein
MAKPFDLPLLLETFVGQWELVSKYTVVLSKYPRFPSRADCVRDA